MLNICDTQIKYLMTLLYRCGHPERKNALSKASHDLKAISAGSELQLPNAYSVAPFWLCFFPNSAREIV